MVPFAPPSVDGVGFATRGSCGFGVMKKTVSPRRSTSAPSGHCLPRYFVHKIEGHHHSHSDADVLDDAREFSLVVRDEDRRVAGRRVRWSVPGWSQRDREVVVVGFVSAIVVY